MTFEQIRAWSSYRRRQLGQDPDDAEWSDATPSPNGHDPSRSSR